MEILAIATNADYQQSGHGTYVAKMPPRAQLSTTKHDSVPQKSRGFNNNNACDFLYVRLK